MSAQGSGRILAPPPPDRLQELAAPPSFSVILIAYQAAETVGEAVRSALAQTHPAHEVIVVDDGSTDDSASALRPFEGDITLIRKDNGGAASARNVGLAAATGEFVAFLDADDRFHPKRIECLAELARRRPDLDMLSTDMVFIVDGEEVGSFLADNPFAVVDQRIEIMKSCFVGAPPAVRAERLRAIGGFDESLRVASDWDGWLRLILDGAGAGLVERPYYEYVLHSGTLTSGRVDSLWARARLLEKAVANPAVRADELPLLERQIRRRRSEAVVAEAQAGAAGRRRFAGLAVSPRLTLRARLAAVLALVSPALARRRLRSRRAPAARLASAGG